MKTLYLTRHAKSSWTNPDLDDFNRPLNKRGKRDAPRMGRYLQQHGRVPDHIISSPAQRAQSTAHILAENLGYPVERIVFQEDVYLAETDTLIQIIRTATDRSKRLMLVGHNPGMTDLANTLSDAQIANLPTCGVVGIDFNISQWHQLEWHLGKRQFFFYPKMMDASK